MSWFIKLIIIVGFIILIEIVYSIFRKKSMFKIIALHGYATLKRVSARLAVEALAIIGLLVVVCVISIRISPTIETVLKTKIGYEGVFSEGLLFNFVAASATVLALYNTIRILRQVTSDIHSFESLLASVNSELDKVANCPEAIAVVMRPFFCMYVKTPSFGHISGEGPDAPGSSYQVFKDLLKRAVIKRHVTVRIVCLEKRGFQQFHSRLTSDPGRITTLNQEAEEVFDFIQAHGDSSLKSQTAISDNFLIVTSNRAWQFVIKPVPGNGRHDVSGREIKKSEDIRFARESIEQYWVH